MRALTSHPSQPLFTTYIISENEPLAEKFCETQRVPQVNHCLQHTYFPKMKLSQKFFARLKQVTQVNHCLRHTYFKNLKLSQKIFARPDKSTKSTSNCNTYIFEIISLSQISWLDSASQPSQPLMTTHIFSKSTLSGNFCEKWRVTQVNQHLQRICFG